MCCSAAVSAVVGDVGQAGLQSLEGCWLQTLQTAQLTAALVSAACEVAADTACCTHTPAGVCHDLESLQGTLCRLYLIKVSSGKVSKKFKKLMVYPLNVDWKEN